MVNKLSDNIFVFLSEVGVIFKDSGLIFAATAFGSLVLFLANIMLARLFAPEVFGSFKIVLNLTLIAPAVLNFGASVTLAKYVAEFSGKKAGKGIFLIKYFIRLRIITFMATIVVLFLARDYLAGLFFNDASAGILLVAGLAIVAASFFDIYYYIITGFQRFRLLAASQLILFISIGIFAYSFGYFGGVFWALIGWGLGMFLGSTLPLLFTTRRLRKTKATPFPVKPIFLKYSLPMYLMIIPNAFSIAVVPILSIFFSQTLIGYYSFALIFYNGIILLPTALYQVLLPKIASMHGNKQQAAAKKIFVKTVLLYAGIGLIGFIGINLFAKEIITLLSPKYLPGEIIFRYIVSASFLIGAMHVLQTYYTAVHKIKKVALIVITQNVILAGVSFFVLSLLA